MNTEEVKALLKSANMVIAGEKRLDYCDQLRLKEGQIINVFDKGTVNVQGKNKASVENILKLGTEFHKETASASPLKVFVVYGHDTNARTQLEAMLRRWGLEPLILDQLASEGQTIIEKLENYTQDVRFGIVLATPDDEGNSVGSPEKRMPRARQNVILEMGMLLAKLGRQKVAVLIKDPSKMERPSDIQGLIYIPFLDNVEKEVGVTLAKEMDKQGFNIAIAKL